MASILIPQGSISVLQTVSVVRAAAAGAALEHELASVARAINMTANTGDTVVRWNSTLSPEVRSTLTAAGYTVTRISEVFELPDGGVVGWVISFTPPED